MKQIKSNKSLQNWTVSSNVDPYTIILHKQLNTGFKLHCIIHLTEDVRIDSRHGINQPLSWRGLNPVHNQRWPNGQIS